MTAANDHLQSLPTQPSPEQEVPDEFDLLCEHCGYSLVGLTTTNRCPECGEEFDPLDLPLARVPWLFRKRLGTIASYRQTVWEILRRPTDFAKELCRPVRVSALDAAKFRRFTIRIVMLTAVLGALIVAACLISWASVGRLFTYMSSNGLSDRDIQQAMLGALMIVSGYFLLHLMPRLMTDLPTFIWEGFKDRPMDLAPLHHYACAPLALMPIVLLPVTLLALLPSFAAPVADELIQAEVILLCISLTGPLLLLWVIPLKFMRAATNCTRRRLFALALYLPLHGFLSAVLCMLAFFTITYYIGHLIAPGIMR
jgi:hypothetical protein